MTHILMVAAENGALPGGKVGGIGDVVRDVPTALARRSCRVSVITPAYGVFARLPGARQLQTLRVRFGGQIEAPVLYRLDEVGGDKVRHYVIDHPLFSSCGAGRIYCDDPPGQPFRTDAGKFALFCRAVAVAIESGSFADPDVLHLHDWHAAFLLILRRYDPGCASLRKLRCVYSIHNLAVQGIRPFANDASSLEAWYPDLVYVRRQLADPRWSDCVNPMASAIRLADAVHTVSPSYAEEILSPGDSENGIHGGEGLEQDLRAARDEKRLFGILNGCEYPAQPNPALPDWPALLRRMRELVLFWASGSPVLASTLFLAHHALARLSDERPHMLLTSVGRITDQKIGLMRQPTTSGRPALHLALEALGDRGMLLMVGTGDPACEQFLGATMAAERNFVYLRGYSDELGDAFYRQGDLFFMPSSFEPCGISQMLALRAGQPCLVHNVGGLRDTVRDNRTGFVFGGNNLTEQADALVATLRRAIDQFDKKSSKWQTMREAAAAARFDWADSIDAYLQHLYRQS
ncbi:MAG: glycogen/starch synthase [Gammaproteobacteria bacterium]|nr:glycogen/starch synthase [Gammaproteobacteria bacterium]